MKPISIKNLNSFLALGYFLDYDENKYLKPPDTNVKAFSSLKESDLIKYGSDKLIEVFNNVFVPNSQNLVPLSGGFDSRAIIGGLLEFTESYNISTYTFGVPGSMDFEIGRMISKKMGIKNIAIDLNEIQFTQDILLDTAKRFDFQTFLFFHPNYKKIEEEFGNYKYWSGFLGGESAGSHLQKWEHKDLSLKFIKSKFIEKNRYVKSIDLTDNSGEDFDSLLSGDDITIENLSRYEKIDFFNRQIKYIAPHVMPKGFDVIAPFSSVEWLEFICSIPNKYRVNMYLYEKILLNTFPKLFGFPIKNKLGLSLNSSKLEFLLKRIEFKILSKLNINKKIEVKRRNYYDLGSKIINEKKIKSLVIDNIIDLKKRDIIPWIDIDSIINRHLKKKRNHADALQVLASLEIILKARELNVM